jgi:leucyl-tRNA synthetase
MVLAPEHDLVPLLTTPGQKAAVEEYLRYVNSRSERERIAEVKEVTGAFLGAYAINPFTQEQIPIWIGEYVLKDYGTGAIMAVPSDDDRDWAFAEKFGLPIIDVIDKSKYPGATRHDKLGIMINSGFLDGMEVPDAIEAALQVVEQRGLGKRKVNYKLRDALFSRQRYWGEPFPIVYDPGRGPRPARLRATPPVAGSGRFSTRIGYEVALGPQRGMG